MAIFILIAALIVAIIYAIGQVALLAQQKREHKMLDSLHAHYDELHAMQREHDKQMRKLAAAERKARADATDKLLAEIDARLDA